MKQLLRLFGIAALVAFAVVVYRAIRQYREDSVFDLSTNTGTGGSFGNQRRSISQSYWRSWPTQATRGQSSFSPTRMARSG